MPLFVRLATRPALDLKRGFSYTMGAFGDPSQAHEGLSSYRIPAFIRGNDIAGIKDVFDRESIEQALESLSDYFGGFPDGMRLVLVEGGDRGVGPDGENLVFPTKNVASWRTSALPADMVGAIARAARKAGYDVR